MVPTKKEAPERLFCISQASAEILIGYYGIRYKDVSRQIQNRGIMANAVSNGDTVRQGEIMSTYVPGSAASKEFNRGWDEYNQMQYEIGVKEVWEGSVKTVAVSSDEKSAHPARDAGRNFGLNNAPEVEYLDDKEVTYGTYDDFRRSESLDDRRNWTKAQVLQSLKDLPEEYNSATQRWAAEWEASGGGLANSNLANDLGADVLDNLNPYIRNARKLGESPGM